MKWINCSERLPDKFKSVCIKHKHPDYSDFQYSTGGINIMNILYIGEYAYFKYSKDISNFEWLDESEEPVFTKDEVLTLVKDMLSQQKKDFNNKLSSLYKTIKFKWKDH